MSNVADYFPEAPAANVVRIVPLGGVEEVGRNMVAVDVNGDIFVLDAGFHFKEEDDIPGADYTLPNTSYLEKIKSASAPLLSRTDTLTTSAESPSSWPDSVIRPSIRGT